MRGSPATETGSRTLYTFRSRLRWIAILGSDRGLDALSFGHDSPDGAVSALDSQLVAGSHYGRWNDELVRKLRAYARGARETFLDVEIDPRQYKTAFQRKVIQACRRIPWGAFVTYGELASRAGYPGAARAVGNCMANNRIPLVIPCHRVVGADGRLHGYSGLGGLATKRRLLKLEGTYCPRSFT